MKFGKLSYVKKATLAMAVVVPLTIGLMHAPKMRGQAVARPKFEVASIKRCTNPNIGGEGRGAASPESPNRMDITCWSLAALIRTAYVAFAGGHTNANRYPVRIEHLPAWGNSELYTIEAKAEGSPGQSMMRGPMLQTLLEDRFALKIYPETKDEPAYALTVAKGGFKLPPFHGTCTPLDPIDPSRSAGHHDLCPRDPKDSVMSLDIFAWVLGNLKPNILDGPVINKTGISGYFHFDMEDLLKHSHTGAPSDDPLFASVFTAVADLGLKLQATKAPRPYFVVDHVERPSAN